VLRFDVVSTVCTFCVLQCAETHGELDIFYVNEIMDFDYKLQELDWENKTMLGKGSFAEVYKSEIKRKRKPVALKVGDRIITML